MKFQCRMEDFFANSSEKKKCTGCSLEEIGFSATFLHHRLICHQAKCFDERKEGRKERKETKKEREGKEKKERKLMEKYGDPSFRIGHRIILDLLMQFS